MVNRAASDEQLLSAFVAGERRALEELARRYETSWLGLARGMLGGRYELACDAVQETWIRIIRFGAGFSGTSRFKTWAYRILVNQCHTMLNAGARIHFVEGLDSVAADAVSPERALQASDDNHAVQRAVGGLDAARRDILLLCYHEGLTHEEAAQVLEIPLGTLKSRLHAALEELRSVLRKDHQL